MTFPFCETFILVECGKDKKDFYVVCSYIYIYSPYLIQNKIFLQERKENYVGSEVLPTSIKEKE